MLLHDAFHVILNAASRFPSFEHWGLKDLFAIGVFLVWVEGEVGVHHLLRHSSLIEGKLELYLQVARTLGLVRALVLISASPGLLILAHFNVLPRNHRDGIGTAQVHHQSREDDHAHAEVLNEPEEVIVVFQQELLRFEFLARIALVGDRGQAIQEPNYWLLVILLISVENEVKLD